MIVRKILCKLGIHSIFVQHDKWGSAKVCRYCAYVKGHFLWRIEPLDRLRVGGYVYPPFEVQEKAHGKCLDLEPWQGDYTGQRQPKRYSFMTSGWVFAPRPGYSQDREDYE